MQTYNIQTAPFQELVAMPTASATHLLFDIIIEEEINLITYCNTLFKKIFELPQSQFPDFINYQCSKVKNAFSWLNKLEKLIALNSWYKQETSYSFTYSANYPSTQPIYRLSKASNGDYLYTTNADERDQAVNIYGYKFEGTSFNFAP